MGAAAVMQASMGMQAFGGGMASLSAYSQGRQAQQIANLNADVLNSEAKQTREATEFVLRRKTQEGERVKGALRVAMATSGAMLDVGAPLMAEAELSKEIDIDKLLTAYEGEKAAVRLENQARMSKYEGKIAKRQGTAAAIGGLMGTGGSLLRGFSEYKRDFG